MSASATPARDRVPFPASVQQSPSSKRLISTSSGSSLPPNGPILPSQSITLDSILATHADAPSPPLAALQQILNERNAFSAHNSQLWKLVEKQRAAYTQILKELERVRSERDLYKSRVSAMGGRIDKEKKKDAERLSKQSSSASGKGQSAISDKSGPNSAEEQVASRDTQDQIDRAFSREPGAIRPLKVQASISSGSLYSTPSLTLNTKTSPSNDPSSSRSAQSLTSNNPHLVSSPISVMPSPVSIPSRSDSLPVMTTTMSTSPEQIQHQDTLSSGPYNGIPQTTRQQPSVSKADTHDNGSPVNGSNNFGTNPTDVNAPTGPYQGTPPALSPTFQTRQLQTSASPLNALRNVPESPSVNTHPQSSFGTASATPNTITLSAPNANTGGLPDASRPHVLSRDSRISLPDEAKQYIANMQNSPTSGSPSSSQQNHGTQNSEQVSPQIQTQLPHQPSIPGLPQTPPHNFGQIQTQSIATPERKRKSSELSPRSAKTISTSNAEMIQFLREGPPIYPGKPSRGEVSGMRRDQDEFLDMDDDDLGGDDDIEDTNPPGRWEGPKKPKTRTAVEDFPLPPSNAPGHGLSQAQAQALLANKEQVANGLIKGYPTIQLSSETQSSTYIPPDQSPPASSPLRTLPASFRALPLLGSDLPFTRIKVSHSSIKPNDKGREVLSFIVKVEPGHGKEGWKVEKLYSDVLGLDARVRASVGKGVGKKIASLPEGKLWRDHAPAKVDQRKAALETYLQTLINLPVKNKDEVIAFFTSDIVRETKKPVMQVGHKEGYLTKRGKNFGGWKTRYFVLQGPVLEYYESRGGTHLGSIVITGAQIGRQQKTSEKIGGDEEKEYRHAFLIVEAKKGPAGGHPRHVLCAESDTDRDSWVEMLVRYVMGSYNEEPVFAFGPNAAVVNDYVGSAPRSSTSSTTPSDHHGLLNTGNSRRPLVRGMPRDEMMKTTQLPSIQTGNGASPTKAVDDHGEHSPARSMDHSPVDRQGPSGFADVHIARKLLERGQPAPLHDSFPLSSSLPSTSSPLDNVNGSLVPTGQRSNSELGHYTDAAGYGRHQQDHFAEQYRRHHGDMSTFLSATSVPNLALPTDLRAPSPEKVEVNGKAKISAPIGGAPIPAGYKFGGKDPSPDPAGIAAATERREKAKSRSFWGFGRPGADKSQLNPTSRGVFGVALEESLEVAQIATLPAVVFRCIEYLEAKQAEQEEGIYRLSGSSAVIKSLKDRFNTEGDVDLLASDEYWDPHAIAGLLKTFLRDLPASILTHDMHFKFLSVIDFVDPQERIKELSQLIAALPIANYSLLRALTAHLILIVQNAPTNKMTMRNVGIVFSPTLGIPAGVFSLMLAEFNRVFNVDALDLGPNPDDESGQDQPSDFSRRNSRQYTDAAADKMLGLAGRTLAAPAEETQSDGDDYSLDESGTETTEGDGTLESSGRSSPVDDDFDGHLIVTSPDTPIAPRSKASHAAATLGLNINISERGNRHSRIIGLPNSPRPHQLQMNPPSPMHTPK